MAQPGTASPEELDKQLKQGAHELMRDAAGNQVMRDTLPVGYVPPGSTLVTFWHLDFPLGGIDYNKPVVTGLLQEMLSVRRLSPPAANALGYRIYTQLPAAYRDEGKVMAAMVLARARQAISEPETWPSLLDEAEMKEAYAAYNRSEKGFELAGGGTAAATAAPTIAERNIGQNPDLPAWLRGLGRGLGMMRARLLRPVPPGLRSIKVPDAGFNKGKPFEVSGPMLLASYIGWILSSGALQAKRRKDGFSAEAFRRGVALP